TSSPGRSWSRRKGSAFQAKCPANAPEDVGAKDRIHAPNVLAMAERGVEDAAPAKRTRPRLRIIAAFLDRWHVREFGALGVDAQEHVDPLAGKCHRNGKAADLRDVLVRTSGIPFPAELVELFVKRPTGSEHLRRRMRGVLDFQDDDFSG